MESLHAEKKLDHFEHESPIRAFTDWTVTGLYAIGKGFRPSLSHMTVYMDAMEAKEGWRLLQILESDTQRPSFVFRCERRLSDEELLARHPGVTVDLPPIMPEVLETNRRKVGIGLRQVAADMSRSGVYGLDDYVDRINGYALELGVDRHFLGVMEEGEPVSPHHMSIGEWVEHGIPITGGPSDLAEMAEAMRPKPFVYDPKMMFRGTMAKGLIDLEKEKLARNLFANPAETIDRVEFGTGRVLESVPLSKDKGDDPINPKHYAGRECADIGERLSANGYQILKYCWRLGKKDDPCQELGKAVWYGESELKFMLCVESAGYTDIHFKPETHDLGDDARTFLEERIVGCSQFTQSVARMLWHGYNRRKFQCILETINGHRALLDCGTGAA